MTSTPISDVLGHEESPDLSCGDAGDAKLRALIREVDEIRRLFRE